MFVINVHNVRLQFDTFTGSPTAEEQTVKAVKTFNSYMARLEGSPQLLLPNPQRMHITTEFVEDGVEGEEKTIATEQKDIWSDNEKYPRSSWKEDVANDSTNLGYWEWVEHQESADEPETEGTVT